MKTLTNLVSNALFASTTGWTGYTSLTGGVMSKTGSGFAAAGSTVAIPDVSGRKYYHAVSCRVSDVTKDTRYGWGLLSGGSNVFESIVLNKNASSFVRSSQVRTSATTQDIYVAVYVPDAVSTTVECNGMLYIDLTTIFGAGNEPTLAWCDANIPFFNGTYDVGSPSPSPSSSQSPSASISLSPSASASPSSSISFSPSTSLSLSPSLSPSPSSSFSPSPSVSESRSSSLSPSPSSSPSPSIEPIYFTLSIDLVQICFVTAYVAKYTSPNTSYSDKYAKNNTTYGDKYTTPNTSYSDKYSEKNTTYIDKYTSKRCN